MPLTEPHRVKPHLVTSTIPALSVANYVEAHIIAHKGGRLAFRDVYLDYEAMAQRRGDPVLDPEQFAASLAKLCKGTSVSAREIKGTVFLVNVRFGGTNSREIA